MGLYKDFINQTRKPEGVLGKMMVNGMNGGHAKMADWGMDHLMGLGPAKVVDIGCGGGRNAGELSRRYRDSFVTALDYSEVSVAKASQYNKDAVEAGKMEVLQGDVSKLSLPQESYDLATAFETIYFWPGLERCFSEVYKILKPSGYFMIVNESDGTDEASLKYESMIEGMKCHTIDEISDALRKAGFTDIKADHHGSKAWIVVIAQK